MTVSLVTGATRGIGRETARQLVLLGHDVWLGARDVAVGEREADAVGARAVRIDVTDPDSIARAVAAIGHCGLDVLVNNAGIGGDDLPTLDTTAAELTRVLDTNLLGAVRVTQAFLPLLRRSSHPVVVNVSSGLGSFGYVTDPDRYESELDNLTYPVSKAALGMATVQYAKALPGFRVVLVDPGWTATDLTGGAGDQTPEQGAAVVVRAVTDASARGFVGPDGVVPW